MHARAALPFRYTRGLMRLMFGTEPVAGLFTKNLVVSATVHIHTSLLVRQTPYRQNRLQPCASFESWDDSVGHGDGGYRVVVGSGVVASTGTYTYFADPAWEPASLGPDSSCHFILRKSLEHISLHPPRLQDKTWACVGS